MVLKVVCKDIYMFARVALDLLLLNFPKVWFSEIEFGASKC
jgi:hypothetical protein